MRILRFIFTIITLLVVTSTSFAEARAAGVIEAVKNSQASNLESGLPNIRIVDWITNTFKQGSNVKWKGNDCGEG